jgi:hypothetical protein
MGCLAFICQNDEDFQTLECSMHGDSGWLTLLHPRQDAMPTRDARPARKTMMLGWATSNFLMEHIEDKVKDEGAWAADHTPENADAMHQLVASSYFWTNGHKPKCSRNASSIMEHIREPNKNDAAEGKGSFRSASSGRSSGRQCHCPDPDQKKRLSY